jgi:hypothetical protein
VGCPMASRSSPDAPSSAPPRARSADLLALERGEIDRATYVERCVEGALRALAARLTPRDLELVREIVREQVATDPVLLASIERVTIGSNRDEG